LAGSSARSPPGTCVPLSEFRRGLCPVQTLSKTAATCIYVRSPSRPTGTFPFFGGLLFTFFFFGVNILTPLSSSRFAPKHDGSFCHSFCPLRRILCLNFLNGRSHPSSPHRLASYLFYASRRHPRCPVPFVVSFVTVRGLCWFNFFFVSKTMIVFPSFFGEILALFACPPPLEDYQWLVSVYLYKIRSCAPVEGRPSLCSIPNSLPGQSAERGIKPSVCFPKWLPVRYPPFRTPVICDGRPTHTVWDGQYLSGICSFRPCRLVTFYRIDSRFSGMDYLAPSRKGGPVVRSVLFIV